MAGIVLDTSALIAYIDPHHQHHKKISEQMKSTRIDFYISAVTYIELMSGASKTGIADLIERGLFHLVSEVVPVDLAISRVAVEARLRCGLKVPDAIISATASHKSAQLWTSDKALAKAHPGARYLLQA